MEKFDNNYNPAYKINHSFNPMKFIDIYDVDDSSWSVKGYRYETHNRTWLNHTELLTKKEALTQSIELLKNLLKEQEEELENIDYQREY